MALYAIDPFGVDDARTHDAADFLLERADHRALGTGMVVVINSRPDARSLLDRGRHAAFKLIVVIGVE